MSSSAEAWKADTTFQDLLTAIENARDTTLQARDEILNKYGTITHLGSEIDSDYHMGVWKVRPSNPDVVDAVTLSDETLTPGYNASLSDLTTGNVVFNLNSTFAAPPVGKITVLTEHVNADVIASISGGASNYDLLESEWVEYDGIKKDLTAYGSEVFFLLEAFGYTI